MSVNIWAVVGTTPGYIPVTAFTGTAGQIFAMDDSGILATWKNWLIIANQLQGPAGSAATPSLCFTGDLTTGWYQPSAGAWAFSAGASIRLFLSSTAFTTNIPFNLASAQLQIDKGADIVAAATTDLGGATGNTLDVTHAAGILAITSLGGATTPAGTTIETKFVIAGGTLTLTHNATSLILLGNADITLQTGDIVRWRKINDASAWWEMVSFQRGVSAGALINKGDWLLGAGGGATTVLPVGTPGQIPVADPAQTGGVQWRDNAIDVVPTRQTVLSSIVDSNGRAQSLTAGAGLNFNVAATTVPLVIAFAGGFGSGGALDALTRLTADQTNQGTLVASNTNYVYAQYVSNSSVSWGISLVPPYYSFEYKKDRFSLLHLDGTDGATTIIDAGGMTWAAVGNAQLDTAQSKFGSASLLLDGTGDYVETTECKTFGPDQWEVSCWFRANATSQTHAIIALENAAGFGVLVDLEHNAGNRRVRASASSAGTSFDLGTIVGTTTTIALNTWYRVRFIWDTLAGNYKLYLSNNGAAETLEGTNSTNVRAGTFTRLRLGFCAAGGAIVAFNGWLDEFRLIRAASSAVVETPKASAFVVNEPNVLVHWFSLAEWKMYEVTGESSAGGVNPAITARERVFHWDCDTGAGSVVSMRNYPIGHPRDPTSIKAWAFIRVAAAGTPVFESFYNMNGSILDNGAGDFTISVTAPFSDRMMMSGNIQNASSVWYQIRTPLATDEYTVPSKLIRFTCPVGSAGTPTDPEYFFLLFHGN